MASLDRDDESRSPLDTASASPLGLALLGGRGMSGGLPDRDRCGGQAVEKVGKGRVRVGVSVVCAGQGEAVRHPRAVLRPHRVRWLDVGRDRKVHGHGLVADHPQRVELVDERDTHLARAHDAGLAVDGELGPTLQHEEDLVAEVVGVGAAPLAGLHPHEAGAYLRCDQHVHDVFPVVVDGERHSVISCWWCAGIARRRTPIPCHLTCARPLKRHDWAAHGSVRAAWLGVNESFQGPRGGLLSTAFYFSTRKPTALFPNR